MDRCGLFVHRWIGLLVPIEAHLVGDLRIRPDNRLLDWHMHLIDFKAVRHDRSALFQLIELLLCQRPLELGLARWLRNSNHLEHLALFLLLDSVLQRRLAILRAALSTSHNNFGIGKSTGIDLSFLWFVVARVRVDIVRLQILSINEATRCRAHISIAICMESRLAKVSCHGTVWQKSPLKLELSKFFTNVFLFLFSQLSIIVINVHGLVSQVVRSISSDAGVSQATIKVSVVTRLTGCFGTLFCIGCCSGSDCLRRDTHLAKLLFNKFPVKLHWIHKTTIFSASFHLLVNTSLKLDRNVEDFRALTKDPQLVLLLIEVRVQIFSLLADGGFLTGSRPVLNLIEFGSERLSGAKQLLIHGLVPDLSLLDSGLLKELLLEQLDLV